MFRKPKNLLWILGKKSVDVPTSTTIVHDQAVEIVDKYKYLGTFFDDKLRWDENTNLVVKKCHQRLYFPRNLKTFSVDTTILILVFFIIRSLKVCCVFHSFPGILTYM